MQWKNKPEAYGTIAKSFHWGMAALIIGMLALGLYMTGLPFSPDKLQLYGIHKAVGATILFLVALRLVWRLLNTVPPLPATLPAWQKWGAHLSHFGLYGLMFAMPLTGWLLSSAAGFPVSVFGLFTLPNLVAPDPQLRELFEGAHEILANLLILLIVAHFGAALKHHVIDKDNILKRMLPALVMMVPLASAAADAPAWQVDKAASTLGFSAVQNNAPVDGTFSDYDAEIAFDPEQLTASHVKITVKLGSVSASYQDVAATLKTPDWFNIDAFPSAVFEATRFTHKGGKEYTAEGTLTLKGTSQPVTLTFTLEEYTTTAAMVKGEAVLSRGAFGVGSGEWEKSDLVKDAVKVNFTLVAKR